MPIEQPMVPTPAGAMNRQRRAGGPPGAGVRAMPPRGVRAVPPGVGTGVGQSPFRRHMPQVGGIAGPTVSGPKPPSSTGATGMIGTPTPASAFAPKGGGVFMENGGVNGGLPAGAPASRPTVPSPGGYGGFNPTQLTQQGGQWGAEGRGGQFQALGPNALARWLHEQPSASGPAPSGPPETPVGGPPSGPPMAQGYVNAQQFADPIYDWFRNSQPQGANDWNAFNQWFQNFGRTADPAAWDRLYGSGGGVPPGPAPPPQMENPYQ